MEEGPLLLAHDRVLLALVPLLSDPVVVSIHLRLLLLHCVRLVDFLFRKLLLAP